MRGPIVFVRWLMGFRRRIWVGRVVRRARSARAMPPALWSADETRAIAAEMRRVG